MINETQVAEKVVKSAENLVKKAWSILDAASEKKSPSEYLSQAGKRAMQGK